jgi:two-component sensor histidine kinase
MIVHELATNAIKYGALSTEQGRIDVTWTLAELGDHREITLEWRESGGPQVVPPVRRGFGTRLIERGIAANVKSDVALEFRPEGLHCRFVTRHLNGTAEADATQSQ